jgi:hypothetical protein
VITDDGGVDAVDELLAEVKAARRADSARKRHTERVKELLVQVRRDRPDLSVVEIEDMIGRFYDRSTISRMTASVVKARAQQS